MRRLVLLLCALCAVMGMMLLKEREDGTEPAPQAPSERFESAPAQPDIVVEEVRLQEAPQETARRIQLQVYHEGALVKMDMEDYLVHVVAGEMPAAYETEALRAQAVAARSYLAWKSPACGGGGCSRAQGADICSDSTHCMAYKSEAEMRADWGGRYEEYRAKVEDAVSSTEGQVMLWDGSPVQALFHASSGGRTEDAQAVWGTALPYLTSVTSEEEDTERTKRMSRRQLVRALNAAFDGAELTERTVEEGFAVLERTAGGRVQTVRVGAATASGREVRSALGLSSTAFAVDYAQDEVIITTQGYGHGVGMSQEGANAMAREGCSWQEILMHYYTGVQIGKLP